MNDDWTKEIRARLAAATPGPWRLSGDWTIQTNHITRDVWNIAHCLKFAEVNRGFIAHAPTDLLNLLREREVLREALKTCSEPFCHTYNKSQIAQYALAYHPTKEEQ